MILRLVHFSMKFSADFHLLLSIAKGSAFTHPPSYDLGNAFEPVLDGRKVVAPICGMFHNYKVLPEIGALGVEGL